MVDLIGVICIIGGNIMVVVFDEINTKISKTDGLQFGHLK
jgi:hypothetical protein